VIACNQPFVSLLLVVLLAAQINAVIVNGRLMDRRTLYGLLAQMAAATATN
jgi:hypothetical protein